MKRILFLILSFIIVSCDTTEVYIDVYDPVQAAIDSLEQRENDIDLIYSYLEGEGINYVDTTQKGGFYSIIDEGNKEVFPEAGKIAVFHNCFPGTDTPNPGSLHGASPVLSGEKWAINLWFRKNKVEQEH